MTGSTFLEKGRRSYSRVRLLVEHQRGLVRGFDLALASKPFVEAARTGLVKALLASGLLPGTLWIDDKRLEPILGQLCKLLNIKLLLSETLDCLADAEASLTSFMQSGAR